MRIPVGTTHTASFEASKWSSRICDHCGSRYFYKITREVTESSTDWLWLNQDGAINSAKKKAMNNANIIMNKADDIYSCPKCGYFPELFARKKLLQDQLSRIRSVIFLIILESLPIYGVFYGIINRNSFITLAGVLSLLIILFGFFVIVNTKPIKNLNLNADSRKNQKFCNSYPVLSEEDFENNNQIHHT